MIYNLPRKVKNIVTKGDLIALDLDGNGSKQYKVLKCKGNVAQVMAMWDDLSSIYNSTSMTTDFNGTTAQKYESSTLDTYLNTTWYNTLSSEAKNAIIPENVVQYCYKYYNVPNTPNSPLYTYQYQYNWGLNYWNADSVGNVVVGNRNVFALDLKDIFDYIGKVCITSNELMTMFWNTTISIFKRYLCLWSSLANGSDGAWCVYGEYGYLDSAHMSGSHIVRPALNLDLSKIQYTVIPPVTEGETWILNNTLNFDDITDDKIAFPLFYVNKTGGPYDYMSFDEYWYINSVTSTNREILTKNYPNEEGNWEVSPDSFTTPIELLFSYGPSGIGRQWLQANAVKQ